MDENKHEIPPHTTMTIEPVGNEEAPLSTSAAYLKKVPGDGWIYAWIAIGVAVVPLLWLTPMTWSVISYTVTNTPSEQFLATGGPLVMMILVMPFLLTGLTLSASIAGALMYFVKDYGPLGFRQVAANSVMAVASVTVLLFVIAIIRLFIGLHAT